jgi:hypothetical protein
LPSLFFLLMLLPAVTTSWFFNCLSRIFYLQRHTERWAFTFVHQESRTHATLVCYYQGITYISWIHILVWYNRSWVWILESFLYADLCAAFVLRWKVRFAGFSRVLEVGTKVATAVFDHEQISSGIFLHKFELYRATMLNLVMYGLWNFR